MISRDSKAVRSGQAGFTLVELAVALGVTVVVMLGVLALFDFNNKLTRVQTNVADMQQSLRIAQHDMVRMARMTGRGGLTPAGGVEIADNVPDGTRIENFDRSEDRKVLAGTDVLTLRGTFTLPIYQVAFTQGGSYTLTGGSQNPPTPASAEGGTIELCPKTPAGALQPLDALKDQISKAAQQQLVLVNPLDDRFFVVVKADTAELKDALPSCPLDIDGNRPGLELKFKIERPGVATDPHHYGPLSPRINSDAELALSRVAFVGVLEEYRFYVQEKYALENDEDSDLTPVLCRATFIGESVTLCDEIADGVLDLQASLGLDTSNDGSVFEDPADLDADEWFGNGPNEIVAADVTNPAYLSYADLVNNNLKSLRLSTLVRTRRADNAYEAEALPQIENHTHSLSPADLVNGETARKYRRRLLQTIVNLRNLTT